MGVCNSVPAEAKAEVMEMAAPEPDADCQSWVQFYLKRLSKGPALWQVLKSSYLNFGDPDEVVFPERFLEAAGELFILMLAVCWALTAAFNPGIIQRNLLHDVVGYNNLCVGFDTPPARYAAVPLFTLMSFFGIRYVMLDSVRANLQKVSSQIGGCQYNFTRFANGLYAFFLLFWPMLLVVTPDVHKNAHTFLFFGMIICSCLVCCANFAEAEMVTLSSKIWIGLFVFTSLMLPTLGIVDFRAYDSQKCYDAAGGDSAALILSDNPAVVAACQQEPAIPVWLLATFDYGWFLLLGLSTLFLPEAPPLHLDYELIRTKSGVLEAVKLVTGSQ